MNCDNCVAHVPFTLFPSPIPSRLYQHCIDIQPIISTLMLRIANDSAFIEESLKSVVEVDDFTKNLLNINRIVQKEGLAQPVISCINRSDYMLDQYSEDGKDQIRIRQVEVNAIASGMAAHSCNTKLMHNYLMEKYRIKPEKGTKLLDNQSIELVAQGLIDAFNAYNKPDGYILFITEERCFNFADQLALEFEVQKTRPDIRIIRRSFISLPYIVKLGPNKELFADLDKEIAVIYFRYCYDPSNYSYNTAWDIRLLLERSRAIKCPSINFHLSGAKKFQQVLNNQEQLERFLSSSDAEKLTNVFCKFWSLEAGSPGGNEGYNIGTSSPENLVLKPQREGGGHNIFGEDIKAFLNNLNRPEDRSQYILMEYINSPKEKNWLLMQDDDCSKDNTRLNSNDLLVSELGIFGSVLAEGLDIMCNRTSGYLMRSKKYGNKEGGVAAGYAGLSSIVLVDDARNDIDLSLFFEK